MGKIASWNDIYQKFNVGERSNRCLTKKEILAYTGNLLILSIDWRRMLCDYLIHYSYIKE